MTEGAEVIDGRRARADRSRDAVIDALLELFREGDPRPSLDAVAARSGVSRRSIFRLFDDIETLHAAAIDHHVLRLAPLAVPPEPGGTLAVRVRALVAQRARLYEEISPFRVVTERLRGKVALVDQRLAEGRALLRDQLVVLFDEELTARTDAERRQVVEAAEVASSWEAWHVLRTTQGLDPDDASAVVARLLSAVLTAR